MAEPQQSGSRSTQTSTTGTSKFQKLHPDGIYEVEILGHAFASPKDANGNPDPKGTPYLVVKVQVNKLKQAYSNGAVPAIIPNAWRDIRTFFTPKCIDDTKTFLSEAGFRGGDLRVLDKTACERYRLQHVSLVGYKFDARNKTEKDNKGVVHDRFQVARKGGIGNKWMDQITKPQDAAFLTLGSLWKSASPQASAPAAPAPAQQQAPREFSDADENGPPVDDSQFTSDPDWN